MEDMNQLCVETEGLGRRFGNVRALDDLSLTIPAGCVLALLGPNGAGKTTLLRLLMGHLEPTTGRARVLGADARAMPPEVACRIASMGEGHAPPRWATGRNLFDLQRAAADAFDRAEAEQLCRHRAVPLDAHYSALSKGRRRWLLESLVLASRADLLLLDEPADGLDPSARRDLFDRLRDYVNDTGAGAIVATHVIGDVERVADDVALIDHGRLVLHEPLEDLREHVREVELPPSADASVLTEQGQLLGSQDVAGTRLVWIRCGDEGAGGLRKRLGPGAAVRTVTLESLYLALTDYRHDAPDVEADQ